MVDAISSGADIGMVSAAQSRQSIGAEVEISALKKALDTQSTALIQLLQGMGIGNNINALA